MSAHDLLNLLKRFEEKIILYFFRNRVYYEFTCYLCFVVVFAILSCLFQTALWAPAGKGLAAHPEEL